MASKQRRRIVHTDPLYKCSKDLIYMIYVLKLEFEHLQKKGTIVSLKQDNSNFPGGCLFTIKFLTGQEYELKVVYCHDPKQSALVFKNINSRRDKIIIHDGVDPSVVMRFIKGDVMDFFYKRKRGFDLEELVYHYLKQVADSQESSLIKSVRRAETLEEDKFRRIDFFLKCTFEGKNFTVTFDLKNNRTAIANAIKNDAHQATIFTDKFEMIKSPEKFLDRVHELIIKKIRREGFGIMDGTGSQHVHIG